jgi:hypothetical protein
MRPYLAVVTALTVAVACSSVERFAGAVQLRRDLEANYPRTEIDLGLVNGHEVEVTLNGPTFRSLPIGKEEAMAKEVAGFAFEHYSPSASIDTITITLVRDRTHILIYTKTTSTTWSFATSDLQ